MITIKHKGGFTNTEGFFGRVKKRTYLRGLDQIGREGVAALVAATPRDTGKTAESWSYEIEETSEGTSIYWKNSNVNDNVNIALILQYGHGTNNGGWVKGVDYINPAVRPVFEKLLKDAWKEVTK